MSTFISTQPNASISPLFSPPEDQRPANLDKITPYRKMPDRCWVIDCKLLPPAWIHDGSPGGIISQKGNPLGASEEALLLVKGWLLGLFFFFFFIHIASKPNGLWHNKGKPATAHALSALQTKEILHTVAFQLQNPVPLGRLDNKGKYARRNFISQRRLGKHNSKQSAIVGWAFRKWRIEDSAVEGG